MIKNKKSVIFDLDGTLVDSMGIWGKIDVEYLGGFGLEVPDDLQAAVEGMGFTEVAEYFKERFRIPYSIEEIKQYWQSMAMEKYEKEILLKPGADKVIPWFKEQGLSLAVASSNHISLIEAVLKAHDLYSYFDCIITACDVKKGKPAPDVYLEAARRLNARPGECLVFEDIIPGIQAGKNAGMEVCAVYDSYSAAQDQQKRNLARYYITDYCQVINGTYEEKR